MTMKRLVCGGLILGLMLGVGCGDDEEEDDDDHNTQKTGDAGPGVCDLSLCPQPDAGLACCTPQATCGYDPTGLGLSCISNTPSGVCKLADCPTPVIGTACCTPNATCGSDPFATGAFCFPNAAPVNVDAALPVVQPIVYDCALDDCPEPATGVACCAGNNVCGSDPWGIGLCFANLPEVDAAIPTLPPLEPISTERPDDPSVTGECPSFLGLFGPVWGCCSQLQVCGVFQSSECLVPIGTVLPVSDEDAGIATCTPPKLD